MTAYRRILLIAFVVGAVIIGGGIYEVYGGEEMPAAEPEREEVSQVSEITVYVCGAVNRPGVVQVGGHSRVIDAVKLCGGTLPTADITQVNMAKPLSDGEQVTVPEKAGLRESAGDGKNALAGGGSPKPSADKININAAGKEELDRLPGIGPAMAETIIEYREKVGAFQSVDDLKKVRGIGEAKFNKLKDKVAL